MWRIAAGFVVMGCLATMTQGATVEIAGVFQEYVVSDFEGSVAWSEYMLTTGDDRTYILNLEGIAAEQRPAHGAWVTVRGDLQGDTLTADTVTVITPGARGGPVLGEQRACVLLCNWSADPTGDVTPEQVEQMLFGPTDSANAWWQEVSGGKIWLTGDVYGWYTLPLPPTAPSWYTLWRSWAIALADDDVYFPAYNRLYMLIRSPGFAWNGVADMGPSTLQTDDGPWTTTSIWVLSRYYNNPVGGIRITVHEGGHNFGLRHAGSIRFPEGVIGEFDCGACGREVYARADQFDAMGGGSGWYNEQHQTQLGWLDEGNVVTLTVGGEYALAPYEAETCGIKALRILRGWGPTTGQKEWFYVEWRQPIGFDALLDPQVFNGVLVHYSWNADSDLHTYLLDMTPGDSNMHNAALTVGQSWQDPYSPVRLTVVGRQGNHMIVDVDMGVTARGDMNCDKNIDMGDINPFVLALTDPAAYEHAYCGCPILNGDLNFDLSVDFGDINAFVELLTGGN